MNSTITTQNSVLNQINNTMFAESFEHIANIDCGCPAVYVGSYHKYNCGSIFGKWVDITSFDDYDEFIGFCREIHKDEDDPELMFQDFANFPSDWYSECSFSEELFDKFRLYKGFSDNGLKEEVDAFIDLGGEIENFEDAFVGKYDSEEDFAYQMANECYDLDNLMGSLSYYFDYSAFARDLFIGDYVFSEGCVFRCF